MLSVCYIVKNEEKNIRESLESIKNLADEIIIVDTGSTDNTKKICGEYTEKIFDYEWQNDYGSARNFSLSKATKEWILVLDADERLYNHEGVHKLMNDNEIDVWELVQLTGDIMCQTFRLFKRGIIYKKGYHELLDIGEMKKGKSDVKIIHVKKKFGDKIDSIMDSVRMDDDEIKKQYYEGIYQVAMGNLDVGMECLNKIIDKVTPQVRSFIYNAIGNVALFLSRMYEVEALHYFNLSLETSADQNRTYVELADYYVEKKDYDKAMEQLEKVLSRNNLISNLQNDKFYTKQEILNKINKINKE